MPLQPGGPAPYTTAVMATTALDAWRDRGFGVPVTPEILTRAGVNESLARRTFQSLVTLELLTSEGQPTEQFQDFRSTRGEEEYRTRLQEWVRSVYADVLQYADPTTDSYERVTEAFRSYEPAGQRRAMASLLLGLWRYAGLPVAASSATATESNPSRPRPTRRTAKRPSKAKNERAGSGAGDSSTGGGGGGGTGAGFDLGGLPPGLVGLLHQIPRGGAGWPASRRDDFLAAFRAVLDFSVPVRESEPAPVAEDDDEYEEDAS